MTISSLRNCWHAYCSAMAYILIENFIRYEWRRAKAGWENLFLSVWLSVPCTFRKKISPAQSFKDSLHGFAQRIVISWTRRASFYVYYSGVEGAHEYRFCSSLLPSLRTSLKSLHTVVGNNKIQLQCQAGLKANNYLVWAYKHVRHKVHCSPC